MDGLLVRSTSRTLLAAPQVSRYSRAKPHIPTNISRAVAQRSFPCPQPLSSSLFSRPAFLKVSSKEIHTRSMSRAGMVKLIWIWRPFKVSVSLLLTVNLCNSQIYGTKKM
jgi:hypothetical protein